MTTTLSRANELRIDIENMQFQVRYYIGVLAELEQLGKTHNAEFKTIEKNINALKSNIRRIEEELEKVEEAWIDEKLDKIDTDELEELCECK